jgi:hypothetical protein
MLWQHREPRHGTNYLKNVFDISKFYINRYVSEYIPSADAVIPVGVFKNAQKFSLPTLS